MLEVGLYTLSAIVASIALVYLYINNNYKYWQKRNIPYDEPTFLLGILKGFRDSVGFFERFVNVYKKFKGTGPFAGFFMFTTPSVVLLDLDLIKNILIKDFNNFVDRGIFYNERDDPLTAHLFAIDGKKWKNLRGKLTPTFTSGKMRYMFSTMVAVGDELVKLVERDIVINSDVEVKDVLARFTTDVIGSCAFGIDCNSLKDPDAEFRQMGKKVFSGGGGNIKKILFTEFFPNLSRALHLKRIPEDITEFYTRIVRETVEYREKNNVRKNDFMDLLIDLKNSKTNKSENGEEMTPLTMTEIMAQYFAFFLAGFETSSTTMNFALYELAQHHDIQDKLRSEINEIIAKHDGHITYEGVKEMIYLGQVISETLRKFSPVSNLRRKAKAKYHTADPKYVIPSGAYVIIPIFGIHKDPDIFPDPEVFDPDRFTPDNIKKRHPMSWLPFGDGPRNCIGLRFGKLQAQIGLALLIKNFKFTVTKDTPIPLTFSKKAIVLTAEKEIILKVERISSL